MVNKLDIHGVTRVASLSVTLGAGAFETIHTPQKCANPPSCGVHQDFPRDFPDFRILKQEGNNLVEDEQHMDAQALCQCVLWNNCRCFTSTILARRCVEQHPRMKHLFESIYIYSLCFSRCITILSIKITMSREGERVKTQPITVVIQQKMTCGRGFTESKKCLIECIHGVAWPPSIL